MSNSTVKIAPSILSADFSDLRSALALCQQGQADYIHLDVMDGNFVPNLTIGPPVIKALRPHSDKIFDVHIMVRDPLFWVNPFIDAGADIITFHVEATGWPETVIEAIHSHGKKAGISLRPGSDLSLIEPYLETVDLVLVMSVEPGFGGQSFIPQSLERIRTIKNMIGMKNLEQQVLLEVDGGIDLDNAAEVIEAGAEILVAGSAIFNSPDPAATMRKLKGQG